MTLYITNEEGNYEIRQLVIGANLEIALHTYPVRGLAMLKYVQLMREYASSFDSSKYKPLEYMPSISGIPPLTPTSKNTYIPIFNVAPIPRDPKSLPPEEDSE